MKFSLLSLVAAFGVTAPTTTFAFTPTSVIVSNKRHNNQQKQPSRHGRSELYEVITGEAVEAEAFDIGQGGVRLAEESAIKIKGDVKHKPGQADAQPEELLRYDKLTSVDESKVMDIFSKSDSKIICTGEGKEFYKDPGNSLEKFVQYAPLEAVKDAFTGAAPAIDCTKLVFNFLGGDDLMMGEVLSATNELVVMLDINTRAKISFNSLCHKSLPEGSCTVTVVSVGDDGADDEEADQNLSGPDKSIAAGEVYVKDGRWWTVNEADINTAIE